MTIRRDRRAELHGYTDSFVNYDALIVSKFIHPREGFTRPKTPGSMPSSGG